jgi:hypothetical protein
MLNELRMHRKNSPLSTQPGKFKKKVSRKKGMWYSTLA